MAKATERSLNDLHGLVTTDLTNRISKGADCSTADLRTAVDWLAKNNITGVVTQGSPLHSLMEGLTEADQEFVEGLVQ
jgi:hypothetical protein